MPDVSKAVSMDFKKAGDLVYVLGLTREELGCSEYLAEFGEIGVRVPRVLPEESWPLFQALARATEQGLIRSCHDCSDGGLAVALAESAFAGELGAEIDLHAVPLGEDIKREDFVLFSESPSRFVVSVASEDHKKFEELFTNLPLGRGGECHTSCPPPNWRIQQKALRGRVAGRS